MGSEQKNAFLAISLSALILFGWQFYFAPKKPTTAPIEAPISTPAERMGKPAIDPAAGPIEPTVAAASNYTIKRGEVAVTFDNNLVINDFKNPQAAFSFQDTVGAAKPLKVDFDFGKGFETVNLAQTEDNKFYDAAHDLTVTTGLDEKGVATFTATSPKPFRYR
ncbi:MAG: hypothetical protein H0V66_16290, partial [Bdellovibrionales bacterium]|nr:hypothetical protein [Bdellovibrionales bacterium]